MLEKYADSILGKCIAMALKGDRGSLRLCVERLFPARRDGLVQVPRLGVQTITDVAHSSERVLQAIARGQITPMEGETISRILEDRRRVIETADFEVRLKELEELAAENARKRGGQ